MMNGLQIIRAGCILVATSLSFAFGACSEPKENQTDVPKISEAVKAFAIQSPLPSELGGSDLEKKIGPELTPKFIKTPDCRLIGTLLANGIANTAVIADNDQQRIITEGEHIDKNWTLIQVLPGQAKISSTERELWLFVRAQRPSEVLLPLEPEQLPTQLAPTTDRRQKMIQYLAGREPDEVAFPEGLETHGIRQVAEKTMAVNLTDIIEQIRKTPLHRQLEYEIDKNGLRFIEIVPGGIIDEIGFLPGDIIHSIDDTPISSREDLKFLMQIGDQFTVNFSRDDTSVTHTYLIQ